MDLTIKVDLATKVDPATKLGRAIKVDLATNRKVGRVIVQKVVPSGPSVLNSNK